MVVARSSNPGAAVAQELGAHRKDNLSPVVAAQQGFRAARFREQVPGLRRAGLRRAGLQ